jgi:hypothetical protein
MTQAQRILFDTMTKAANAINAEPMREENFIELLSDKDHPSHIFAMAQLEAMEVYGKSKWNEACNGLRQQLKNPMIANDFHINHINPEFKP